MGKFILLIILTLLFAFSCETVKLSSEITSQDIGNPPGTIKITDNVYLDQGEISNLDYLEFIYWMKKVYGVNSTEYNRIFPDTNQWSKLKGNYISLDTFYLKHPAYRYHPIVGVSYEQALQFSKWRSDRVMEYILIKHGVVQHKPIVKKDSIFTIEKYFTGKYYNIKPSPYILFYPEYTLPDSTTYYKVSAIADSINLKNYKSCNEKCNDRLLIDCNCIENKKTINDTIPYGPDPTKETNCSLCKKVLITHLKGNVREMTAIKGVFYGNSFVDSCKLSNNICRQDTNLINSYTGFRNICSWKRW